MDDERPISGPCPLCGRPLISGSSSVNRHHLLPKTFGGKEAFDIHTICHSKIHSVFTERELFNHFHTWERLLEHEEIEKFVKWVRKKDPEFKDRNRATRAKREK